MRDGTLAKLSDRNFTSTAYPISMLRVHGVPPASSNALLKIKNVEQA